MTELNENEEIVLRTLNIENIEDNLSELLSKGYEIDLKHALKSRNNIIEKARTYTENKIIYKRKLKVDKNIFSSNDNEKENYISPINPDKLIQLDQRSKDNSDDLNPKKLLTRYKNLNEKADMEIFNVVPKSSFLRVDENVFLSYREIQKQIKKKEIESYQKSFEALSKNSQNLTPFQHNEIVKSVNKDIIKSKKEKVLNQTESEQKVKEGEVLIDHLTSLNAPNVIHTVNSEDKKPKTLSKKKLVINYKDARKALKLPKISFLTEQNHNNFKSFDAALINNLSETPRTNNNKSNKDKENIKKSGEKKYRDNVNLKLFECNEEDKTNELAYDFIKKPRELDIRQKFSLIKNPNNLETSNKRKPDDIAKSKWYNSQLDQNLVIFSNRSDLKGTDIKDEIDLSAQKNNFNSNNLHMKLPNYELLNSKLIALGKKKSFLNKKMIDNPLINERVKISSNKKSSLNPNPDPLTQKTLASSPDENAKGKPIIIINYSNNPKKNIISNNKSVCSNNVFENQNTSRNIDNSRLINPYTYNLSSNYQRKLKVISKSNFNLPSVKITRTIDNEDLPSLRINSPKPIKAEIKSNFIPQKLSILYKKTIDLDSLDISKTINFQIDKFKEKLNQTIKDNLNKTKSISHLKEYIRNADNIDSKKTKKRIIFNFNTNKTKMGSADINDHNKNQNYDIEKFMYN